MSKTVRKLLKNRDGAMAVEFAFVAPVLFMFILGIIDLGQYLWVFNTMQRAADESARMGAVQDQSDSQVQTLAKSMLAALDKSKFTVSVNPASTPVDTLRVQITSNYQTIYPMAFFQPTLAMNVISDFPN